MRFLLIFIFCCLCFQVKAQEYTFSRDNCNLEIYRGAQLRYNIILQDASWADRFGGSAIEVKDGISSINIRGGQIADYTGTNSQRTDSLMTQLQVWKDSCMSDNGIAGAPFWQEETDGIKTLNDAKIVYDDAGNVRVIEGVASNEYKKSFWITGEPYTGFEYIGANLFGLGFAGHFLYSTDTVTGYSRAFGYGDMTNLGFTTNTGIDVIGDIAGGTGAYIHGVTPGAGGINSTWQVTTEDANRDARIVFGSQASGTSGIASTDILAESKDVENSNVYIYVEDDSTQENWGVWIDTLGVSFRRDDNTVLYRMPFAAPTEGQLLQADGSGDLQWINTLISFTPSSESDATYGVGATAYDATYFYKKVTVSPHLWKRIAWGAGGW